MATIQSAYTSLTITPPLAARQAWGRCEYCMICGGYAHVQMFIDAVCTLPPNSNPGAAQLGPQCSFTRADEMFQHDVVLIGPLGRSETAHAVLPSPNMSQEELATLFGHCAPASVRLISGLSPGDWDTHRCGFLLGDHPDPRLQSYASGKDGRLVKVPYRFYIASSVFFYAHATCYNLLCDFAPCFRDRPALIWQLLIDSNKASWNVGMPGIDYLEMARVMRKPGPPLPLWYLGIWVYQNDVYDILSQRFTPGEMSGSRYELYHDWFELAKMWIFCSPSEFPTDAALHNETDLTHIPARHSSHRARFPLDNLPIEIIYHLARYLDVKDALTLLCINTALRARLVDAINYYMRHCVPPWAWPPAAVLRRFEFARDILTFETHPFPWLSYLRECYVSHSMRNRRRIWCICMQFEALASARASSLDTAV